MKVAFFPLHFTLPPPPPPPVKDTGLPERSCSFRSVHDAANRPGVGGVGWGGGGEEKIINTGSKGEGSAGCEQSRSGGAEGGGGARGERLWPGRGGGPNVPVLLSGRPLEREVFPPGPAAPRRGRGPFRGRALPENEVCSVPSPRSRCPRGRPGAALPHGRVHILHTCACVRAYGTHTHRYTRSSSPASGQEGKKPAEFL